MVDVIDGIISGETALRRYGVVVEPAGTTA